MNTCPKCEFELPAGAAECPACGIVLAKYRERGEAPSGFTGAEPPPPPPGDHDPYTPPDAPLVDAGGTLFSSQPVGMEGGITSATLDALRKTRPWLRFLVGYGFVVIALMIVGAVGMLVGGALSNTELGPLALGYLFYALFYALIGLALLMPLRRSSQALRDVDGSSDVSSVLESFTEHQATFWRRTGILFAVGVAIMVLAIVIMVIAAAASVGG